MLYAMNIVGETWRKYYCYEGIDVEETILIK
jgi:hypothetical protein